MTFLRTTLTLACVAALAATSGVQAQGLGMRPGGGTGITDIMRGGPRVNAPAPVPRAATAPLPAPAGQRAAEYIVALVNSEPITNTEVQSRVERVMRESAEAQRMPRSELTRLVLERVISERAQLQLAKENGIKIDDIAVDQAEETVARQNQIGVAELRRRLGAEGISQSEFRTDLRNQLTLTRLREREVNGRVKISDVEVDQFLQEQRSVAKPQEINLAQVLVLVPENATEPQIATLQQKAQAIVVRARAGEDFAKLARELSDAPDRASGGVLGLRPVNRYPALFLDATQGTAVDGIVEAMGQDHPFLVQAGDPMLLAAIIGIALGDADAARAAGALGKSRFLHHFQADRMAMQTAALYSGLLAPSSQTPQAQYS